MKCYARATILVCLLATITPLGSPQEKPRIRISVENFPGHVQTEAVRRFAEDLERRLGDRFSVEFYHSGQLFRDSDVLLAMSSGSVEIAVPGIWQVDKYERSAAAFLLPVCFGRTARFIRALSDGPTGQEISRRMEESLNVAVLGRWIDLGHANLYFSEERITSHDELSGLRIRVAGGLANERRIEALGVEAVVIPWNDLPFYLEQGRLDGVLTTHETTRSGRLWEQGIRYAFEDQQCFAQYVPLIRRSFRNRLTNEDREELREAWERIVDFQRERALEAQEEARRVLREHGIKIIRPTPAELDSTRQFLLERQDEMARELGVPRAIVRLLTAHG